ncbi:MAG TPA: hypothetical protein VFV59_08035 [Candidatus Limnocylindria bacterium]|nr:hypothetical protein [Candidatus Limnocylindria bacterium]
MTTPIRTVVERGPKGKRAVAFAIDWPGWSRGAKSPDEALETLEAYRERYRPVARHAGLDGELDGAPLEIVEDHQGNTSTDFWGISWLPSSFERGPMEPEVLERRLALLAGAWRFFDEVAARVSPELRRGPRGGGRSRDEIIAHVFGNERVQFSKKVGVATPPGVMLTPDGLRRHRDQFLAGIRDYNAADRKVGRTWTLQYLVRHATYHVLDHAWELEDRDLS